MKKQFIIGIGSQRAGSTLLHKLLDESSEIYMNPVKELHYFDTIFNVRSQNTLTEFSKRQFQRELSNIIDFGESINFNKQYKNLLRASYMLYNSDVKNIEYIDLFRPSVKDNKMLGEITPEYSLLNDNALKYMYEVLGEAKIILLVRNPVQRFISAYKLLKMYGKDSSYVCLDTASDEILNIINTEGAWLLQQDDFNDYEEIEIKYKKFFSNVLMLPYDYLFLEKEFVINSLESFLGIDIDHDTYNSISSKRVNSLSGEFKVSDEVIDILNDRYSKSINFLEKKFGKDTCKL